MVGVSRLRSCGVGLALLSAAIAAILTAWNGRVRITALLASSGSSILKHVTIDKVRSPSRASSHHTPVPTCQIRMQEEHALAGSLRLYLYDWFRWTIPSGSSIAGRCGPGKVYWSDTKKCTSSLAGGGTLELTPAVSWTGLFSIKRR